MKNPLIDVYYLLKRQDYQWMTDADFSETIGNVLYEKKPFMAGRMGAYESSAIRMFEFGYKQKQKKMMEYLSNNAGFFPKDIRLLSDFASTYKKALSNCDIIYPMGYRGENYLISRFASDSIKFYRGYFNWNADDIWFKHLRNKKVLIIHPFAKTIREQYDNKRELLHRSSDFLPEFELMIIKAVFTAAGEIDDRFANWFEALDYMHNETLKYDYDIALLGCGSYGFPLASMIKEDGKIAVHMGGELQLLFGIKGARWEQKEYGDISLYNDSWVYADHSERPKNFTSIEGSSYWETVGKDEQE